MGLGWNKAFHSKSINLARFGTTWNWCLNLSLASIDINCFISLTIEKFVNITMHVVT